MNDREIRLFVVDNITEMVKHDQFLKENEFGRIKVCIELAIQKTREECEKEKKIILKHLGIEENAVVVKEEGKTAKELMLELVDREQRIDRIREDVMKDVATVTKIAKDKLTSNIDYWRGCLRGYADVIKILDKEEK